MGVAGAPLTLVLMRLKLLQKVALLLRSMMVELQVVEAKPCQ
jgi:hypothetical protein